MPCRHPDSSARGTAPGSTEQCLRLGILAAILWVGLPMGDWAAPGWARQIEPAPASAVAETILVGAPTFGGFCYGMCCTSRAATEFTLSQSAYVTSIDIMVTGGAIFDFTLQDALIEPITEIAQAVITTRNLTTDVESIPVNKMVAAGTYYLVGTEDPASGSPMVSGWCASDGVFVTNAGGVVDGLWGGYPNRPWSFRSGPYENPPVDTIYTAPVFAVKTRANLFPSVTATVRGCRVGGS